MFSLNYVEKQTVLTVGGITFIVYILRCVARFRAAAASIGNHPGWRTFYQSRSLQSAILPAIRGITTGRNSHFSGNFQAFQEFGWDIHADISLWPRPTTTLTLASATAIKEVTTNRAKWPKHLETYAVLNFYGRNIVSSEGDEWKKNRKIVAPAFTDRNNHIVWDQTLEIMSDLFDNVWGNQEQVTYDDAIELAMPLTLFVLSAAGFGQKANFTNSGIPAKGHGMTFQEALQIVDEHLLLRALLPTWIYRLTAKGRRTLTAFDELHQYILEMIEERRTAVSTEGKYDLLTGLIDANEEEDKQGGGVKLDMGELTGNIFIILVAGHETAAHTLAWMFALLALYPDEQEKLYHHVKSLMPDGQWPGFKDMPKFTRSLAVMYETIRLFPPVVSLEKVSAEDTSLVSINTATGEQRQLPVPKGTRISISIPGLHYNSSYWEDPQEFRPERFLSPDWPKEAFVGFHGGPRACPGRKFSETETVAILSVIIERYSIHVKEEPQFAHETFEQKKKRVLSSHLGLTLTPAKLPITFKRRY
ncbi:cytochrome P450 [Flagelloscypha sp. PMI_526]|nr:cytochrome P450 [Flagelloscypha sp. PMI_526]